MSTKESTKEQISSSITKPTSTSCTGTCRGDKKELNLYQIFPAFILGLALIVSSSIGSFVFLIGKNADNAITVTGSAKKQVTSDTAKWVLQASRITTGGDLRSASNRLSDDIKTIDKFMEKNGFTPDEITISPVFTDQIYKPVFDGINDYMVRQTVTVQTSKVKKVAETAQKINTLFDSGVNATTLQLEYYYSGLAEIRRDLLAQAIIDAKARALQVADAGGVKIGSIMTANSGVIQVLQPNSVDINDYGSYDTTTIDKEVMATIRATFSLK